VSGEPLIAEAACVPVVDADGFDRLALFVAAEDPLAAIEAAATRLRGQAAALQAPEMGTQRSRDSAQPLAERSNASACARLIARELSAKG
jgi:hypothetical protein